MKSEKSYNYKVYYTWKCSFPKIKGSKEKIFKKNINVAFETEPSDYDIERHVKDYINSLIGFMSDKDSKIEFNEIVKIKKLKVVKGIKEYSNEINESDLDDMIDSFG